MTGLVSSSSGYKMNTHGMEHRGIDILWQCLKLKTWYSISFNLTSRVQIISDHKHISCFPMLLRSTKHISWPLWWWWWYELLSIRVRPYKSSKFKAQIGELFCKNSGELLNVAKSLARHCMGPSNPKTNSWHNKETRKIAPEILAPRGHKSLQYNQNYNQVFTLLMLQNKDLFNT